MGKLTSFDVQRHSRLVFVVSLFVAIIGCAQQVPVGDAESAIAPPAAPPGVVAIKVFYKLDRHLTAGIHMGERWVSPETFHSTLQVGRQATVEIRAVGLTAQRQPVDIVPLWLSADTDRVTVSQATGANVTLHVQDAGETILQVALLGVSNELTVVSKYNEKADNTKVEITQQGLF